MGSKSIDICPSYWETRSKYSTDSECYQSYKRRSLTNKDLEEVFGGDEQSPRSLTAPLDLLSLQSEDFIVPFTTDN
jgi:hypothetical protein